MTIQDKIYTDIDIPENSAHFAAHILDELDKKKECLPVSIATIGKTLPKTWDRYLAYGISMVGSPPVLGATAMAIIASTLSNLRVWMLTGGYVFLAILTPLLNVFWRVRRGRITDVDVQLREQRIQPLLFAIVCSGLGWLGLVLSNAPQQLLILAGATSLQTAVALGITLRWKISLHCAAAAGVATVAWSLAGTPLPMLVGVPLIAWSRLWLRRHTPAQIVAGTLLGVTIFLPALSLVRK